MNKRHVLKDMAMLANKYCFAPDRLHHSLSRFSPLLSVSSTSYLLSEHFSLVENSRHDIRTSFLQAFCDHHSTQTNQKDVDTYQERPTRLSYCAPQTPPRTSRAPAYRCSTPRLPSHAPRLSSLERGTTRCHCLLLPSIHSRHLHTRIPCMHELGQRYASQTSC